MRLLILQSHTANNAQRSISVDNPQPAHTDPSTHHPLPDSGVATQTLDPGISSSAISNSQQSTTANVNKSNIKRPSTISLGPKASITSTTSLFEDLATPAATPLFAKKKLFDEDTQTEGDSQVSSGTNPGDVTPLTAPTDGPVNFGLQGMTSESAAEGGDDLGSVLQDSELVSALMRMGLRLDGDEQLEKQEELCQNILIILFTVVWKGVEGCDNEAWKVSGVTMNKPSG